MNMPPTPFEKKADPVVRNMWIAAGVLMAVGAIAGWAALQMTEAGSQAQLLALGLALVTFLPGMFIPVFIQARQLQGEGATEFEGEGGNQPDTLEPDHPVELPDEPLRISVPELTPDIAGSIRNTWILAWLLVVLVAIPVPVAIHVWGFDGPDFMESPPVLVAMALGMSAIALGGARSHAQARRRELDLIRQSDDATAFTLDEIGARVGIAFLLGPGRKKLGRKGLPVLHIPWADVERWEVRPGATSQTSTGGTRSTPPQYHVYQHDDPRASIDRTHFAGREEEILTRVKAHIEGTIVLRDELLD